MDQGFEGTRAGGQIRSAEELDRLEEDLLAQTTQIVAQVQAQLADLGRREQSLNAQLGQVDAERRAIRF